MLGLDHIAVAAETLEAGRDYVESRLGMALRPGGQHAHFGTHNMLLGLADGLYLEVIAIDPSAPKPAYPRWFDLDRFTGAPRVGNWICRSDDLDEVVATMPQAGRPVALSRGDLHWSMAVPETGQLPYDDCFPACMQWRSNPVPAEILPPSGCRLIRLTVRHPDAGALKRQLSPHFNDPRVVFETGAPGLSAVIDTPTGEKVL